MQDSFLFSGFGGQGVMFAGQLLAYAGMDAGYHVTWIPSYGPEMRGGTAHCFVILSDQAIGSPVLPRPAVALVFNQPSYEKYAGQVAPGGLLVFNSSLITADQSPSVPTLAIPATATAHGLGDARLMNMVMLSALLTVRPVLPVSALEAALAAHLPAHRRSLLAANVQALAAGAALAREAWLSPA
ncbi:MAG: 2-oxoacid:acceptor oxidoreductase family protein [Anaerolineae bacterium]|jgi:2-oxoglutarate ferredoxin oxidoreductase subunit gamma|nr:2-oxoacid:acceptor oxidoreductase family protein [Anaerolineae bacterium]